MSKKCIEVIMPYEEVKIYYKKYGIENLKISSKEFVNKLSIALKNILHADYVAGADFPSLGDYCYPAFIFNVEYKPEMDHISLDGTGFYFVSSQNNAEQVMEDLYGSKK